MLTLLLLLACADDAGTSDDSALADDSAATDDSAPQRDDSGAADDSGGGGDDTSPVTHAPSLTDCYAECYLHDVGDQYYQWQLGCVGHDADGFEDEDGDTTHRGTVQVHQGSALVHSDLLSCSREGHCTGSFRESNSGVTCALATQYTFTLQVTDAEGNSSEPVTVQGRQR